MLGTEDFAFFRNNTNVQIRLMDSFDNFIDDEAFIKDLENRFKY